MPEQTEEAEGLAGAQTRGCRYRAALLKLEEDWIKGVCATIAGFKPDVVVTEKGLSDLAMHFLTQAGISAIRRLRKTGAPPPPPPPIPSSRCVDPGLGNSIGRDGRGHKADTSRPTLLPSAPGFICCAPHPPSPGLATYPNCKQTLLHRLRPSKSPAAVVMSL